MNDKVQLKGKLPFVISSTIIADTSLANGHFRFSMKSADEISPRLTLASAATTLVMDGTATSSPVELRAYTGITSASFNIKDADFQDIVIQIPFDLSKELNQKNIQFEWIRIPAPYPITLPPYIAYSRDDSAEDKSVICGLNLELTQDLLPEGRDLEVYADVLSINSSLTLPGKGLTLNARTLVSQGGVIDVSGGPPELDFKPGARAKDGKSTSSPGENGNNGDPNPGIGSPGIPGGKVVVAAETLLGDLHLISNGGSGGRGQDGGNGSDGQPGADGRQDKVGQNWAGWKECDQYGGERGVGGQNGGRGGDGGPAGASGSGANGGAVNAAFIERRGMVTRCATGGKAGPVASVGKAGAGKPGGKGGQRCHCAGGKAYWFWWWEGDDKPSTTSYYPGGPKGDDGIGGVPAEIPIDGTDGTFALEEIHHDAFLTSYQALLSQRVLTLHLAEQMYLNGAYSDAQLILSWLTRVTPRADYPTPNLSEEQRKEWVALNERCSVLLRQLAQGLTFYGHPRNHVPILELGTYQRELDSFLQAGSAIESKYEAYTNKAATAREKLQSLAEMISEQEFVITKLTASRDDLQNNQGPALQDEIRQLGEDLSNKFTSLQAVQDEFRDEVESEAQCTVEDVFTFLTSAILIGADSWTAVSGIVNAIRAVPKALSDVTKDVIKEVETATKSIVDWKAKYDKVKGLITDDSPDAAKIAIEQDDFDDTIKPFLDLESAKKFKKQVHEYLAIIQAKNGKVLKFTALENEIGVLTAQITQKKVELTRVRNRMAGTVDPFATEMVTFMERAYADIRTLIVRNLYRENEAFVFWALQERKLAVATQSIAGLARAHAQIREDIINEKEQVMGIRERFQDVEVVLQAEDRADSFVTFKKGHLTPKGNKVHDLTFAIQMGDQRFRSGRWQVLSTFFAVSVAGFRTNNQSLDVRLIHNGRVEIEDKDGGRMSFVHESVISDYVYELVDGEEVYKGGGSLGGDALNEEIIGLSPFATWTVRIVERDNPGLMLDDVASISIKFSGRYRLGKTLAMR